MLATPGRVALLCLAASSAFAHEAHGLDEVAAQRQPAVASKAEVQEALRVSGAEVPTTRKSGDESINCVDDPNFKEWNHLTLRVQMDDGVHEIGTCGWFASAPHWCHMSGPHRSACKAACSQVIPGLCSITQS
mmetsp:Transcript_6787/g.19206  ORF Transcript_6787/g.19206 Transcript_6787/m.19206 type:complete len:133 (+) Transcript_6787:116-514(+)